VDEGTKCGSVAERDSTVVCIGHSICEREGVCVHNAPAHFPYLVSFCRSDHVWCAEGCTTQPQRVTSANDSPPRGHQNCAARTIHHAVFTNVGSIVKCATGYTHTFPWPVTSLTLANCITSVSLSLSRQIYLPHTPPLLILHLPYGRP
jgi:hypothetical protein